MRSISLNQLYSDTIQWFNEMFGTSLEEFPEGEVGIGSRCVIANALKQNINNDIEWSVGLTCITPTYERYAQCVWLNDTYVNIPTTVGEECMTIEGKEWQSSPRMYTDYSIWNEESEKIELPDYVTRFIEAFDFQLYPHLKDEEDKSINWYADNTPDKLPSSQIWIEDVPEAAVHEKEECPTGSWCKFCVKNEQLSNS